MKLPLPNFSAITGLLARFKKGKGKGDKADKDDEDFLPSSERDDADDAPGEGPEGDDASTDVDDEDDEFSDLDDDEDDEAAAEKRKRLMIMGGGAAAAVLLVGGGLWWFIGSSGGNEVTDRADVVVIDLERLEAETAALDQAVNPNALDGAQLAASLAATADGDGASGNLNELAGIESTGPDAGLTLLATTKQAFAKVPPLATRAEPLEPAPQDILIEEAEVGLIPRISEDGETAFKAYARPSAVGDDKPKVAIIVSGLGHSRAATEAAIDLLPAEVTLAFDSQARGIGYWMDRARDGGHETLLTLPMESATFPFEDPGPGALESLAAPEANIEHLEGVMARAAGYIGLMNTGGSAFTRRDEQMKAVINAIKARGLAYVEGGFAPGSLGPKIAFEAKATWAAVDIELDTYPHRKAIDIKLDEFESMAKSRAVAVARIAPYPVSIEALQKWLNDLESRGLMLVPVSALANKQLVR